jgi:asparagine synthase (glutamine-hydrolysing)
MCGLAGIFAPNNRICENLTEIVGRMALQLRHRGPDDAGVWADHGQGIAFGHRRLSILDLSSAGHQPMHSGNHRFVLAFNGEIYNHLDIRRELNQSGQVIKWHGHSDTETLLNAFERWGIEATLRRSVGMFALALWDRKESELTLARDRMGEKPLYYGWIGQGGERERAFVFGSELKALRAHPRFNNPISRDALALYFQFNNVPAPHSIYENILSCPLVLF